jgi:two-component system phosphate regulon sensor histidine kinase PhoR
MLTNLIDNAIKFNRDNGSVAINCKRLGQVDIISVADTGEGISPEHQERIFERLYRADRGRTRDIGGTGLGLAIVKHLARLHGGEISVRSELGRGTTFSIELPAK